MPTINGAPVANGDAGLEDEGVVPPPEIAVTQLVVIVGNPKPGSRTRRLGEEVARQISGLAGIGRLEETAVIELAEHAGELFDWTSPAVGALVEQVLGADALVVASPTYKGAYTGLLKAFLDRFAAGSLAGCPAVPVMTGGSPVHTLAVEHALRPLLVEIGASTPTAGLYVTEGELKDTAVPVTTWLDRWGGAVQRALQPAIQGGN
jgi:FMN reductase